MRNYLPALPSPRSYSQNSFYSRASLTLKHNNPPPSNSCCCRHHQQYSPPIHPYYPSSKQPKQNELIQDLKAQVKRERMENKLLRKQLEEKEDKIFEYDNLIANRTKKEKQYESVLKEVQQLKLKNQELKSQSLMLSQTISDGDLKISQKEIHIDQLELDRKKSYRNLQKKYGELQIQLQVSHDRLIRQEHTHKTHLQWKNVEKQRIKNKLGFHKQIQVCLFAERDELNLEEIQRKQDKICEKINQNIIAEDTLFRRIQSAESDLLDAMKWMLAIEKKQKQTNPENFNS